MTRSTRLATTLVGLVVSISAVPASAAVVLSDDFNSYAQGLGLTSVGNWMTSSGPDSVGTPGGGVDVIGTGGPYNFYPGNGSYIDLDGTGAQIGPTFFYIDVPVASVVGFDTSYTGPLSTVLTFDIGQNSNGAAGRLVVPYLGIGGSAAGASIFTTTSLSLYATTSTFSGSGSADDFFRVGFYTTSADAQGPILDNVKLTVTQVPEPGTGSIALAGLGFVAWFARRRNMI